jgi:hypothetical protein
LLGPSLDCARKWTRSTAKRNGQSLSGPHKPLNSRDKVGRSTQGISHIDGLSVVVQRWGDVKGSKDGCYTKPSKRFGKILPGALAERRGTLGKLLSRPTLF